MAHKVVDDIMHALAKAKRDLVKEAQKISHEVAKIDAFLSGRVWGTRKRQAKAAKPAGRKRGGKRRISAEGRARIAAAQRKRWAKVRAGKKASKGAAKG